MKIKLGEKIRELRYRDGITQEELAEALGVTGQAVSRWEMNNGYPDMETIPSIANYFKISIDELFGYNGSREEKILKILIEAEKNINMQGDMSSYIDMLRNASYEFPSDSRILLKLGYALILQGYRNHGARRVVANGADIAVYDIEYNKQNVYLSEALEILQKALAFGISHEERCDVIPRLVKHYAIMGEYDKAVEVAKTQDSVVICKEYLLSLAADDKDRYMYQKDALIKFTRQLKNVMCSMVWTNKAFYRNQDGVNRLLSVTKIYDLIFDDGEYGEYHADMMEIYKNCSLFSAQCGNNNDALNYFDIAFYHASKYHGIQSSLNSGLVAPENVFKSLVMKMPDDFVKILNNNAKYQECFNANA